MAKKTISWPLAGSICFLVGIYSCSTPQEKLAELQQVAVDTIAQEVSVPASTASKPLPRTDVRALVSLIDSIYRLVGHSLATQTVKLMEPDTFCLLGFDHNGAKNYFEYPAFQFMEYQSSGAADSAFASVEELTRKGTLRNEDTEAERQRAAKAEWIFDKGGSTYVLLNNLIMHHWKGCNESRKDVASEEQLVDLLFEKYPHARMMQGLCGWGDVKRRPEP